MDPLVSIVTLTYKKFEYLFQTIDSVLTQDYSNIEYIISDDGSLDFPEEEIRNYIEINKKCNLKNVIIVWNKKNCGTVKNINNAYAKASGEILMPLSGDDIFFSVDVVSKVVKEFEKRKCNALTVARVMCDTGNNIICKIPSDKEKKYIKKMNTNLKQYNAFVSERFFDIWSGCVLYLKKDFFLNWGGFDEKYFLLEDAPFYAQYMWKYKMEFAYDLIGIKYHIGGVSTGIKHPLLIKDAFLYDITDKVEHINELCWHVKDAILYTNQRRRAVNKLSLIKLYIQHPVGFLIIMQYRLRKKIASK